LKERPRRVPCSQELNDTLQPFGMLQNGNAFEHRIHGAFAAEESIREGIGGGFALRNAEHLF
jgi:hypothetical protein